MNINFETNNEKNQSKINLFLEQTNIFNENNSYYVYHYEEKEFIKAWRIIGTSEYEIIENGEKTTFFQRTLYIDPVIIDVSTFKIIEDQQKLNMSDKEFEDFLLDRHMDDVGRQTFGWIPRTQELYLFKVNNNLVQIKKEFDEENNNFHIKFLHDFLNAKLNIQQNSKNKLKI